MSLLQQRATQYDRLARALVTQEFLPFLLAPLAMGCMLYVAWDPATDGDTRLIQIPASVLATSLLIVVGFALGRNRADQDAFRYSESSADRSDVDWAAESWRGVGDELARHGIEPEQVPITWAYWPYADISTVHLARTTWSPGGWTDRIYRWQFPRRKKITIIGVAGGVAAGMASEFGVVNLNLPDDPPGGAWVVIPLIVLVFAIGGYYGYLWVRRNLLWPEHAIVVTSEWIREFQDDAPAAAALILHELSHLRHRDPMVRRMMAVGTVYTSFAVWFAAAAVAWPAWFAQDTGPASALLLPVFFGSVFFGVRATRRARRLLPMIQEFRADAEAATVCGPAQLAEGLARFSIKDKLPFLPERLTALESAADQQPVQRARLAVRMARYGFAGPVMLAIASQIIFIVANELR